MFNALLLATIIGLAIYTPIVEAALNPAAINIKDQALYNLLPFSTHIPGYYTVEFKEHGEADPVTKLAPQSTFKMNFSLPLNNVQSCENSGKITAVFSDDRLVNPIKCKSMVNAKPKFNLINENDDTVGVYIYYENPKADEDKDAYELKVYLYCDKTISIKAETIFKITEKTSNTITVKANTPYGCPYMSTSMVEKFVSNHRWLYAGILFCCGVFLLVMGVSMFKYAMFVIATLAVTGSLLLFFFLLFPEKTHDAFLYIAFFLCVIAGLAVGFVAVKYKKWGFLGLGITAGVFAGFFVVTLIQPLVTGGKSAAGTNEDGTQKKGANEWIFYVVIILCGALGGFLMFKLRKNITIICTSFIGSYLVVRSVSIFGGHFPNEIALIRGFRHFSGVGYVYLVFIVILAIAGIYLQHRIRNKKEAEEEKIKELGYAKAADPETVA